MKAQLSKQHTKTTPVILQDSRTKEKPTTEMPILKEQPLFDDGHARITARAYELYLERGCREGCAEEDWLDAEREILNRTLPV